MPCKIPLNVNGKASTVNVDNVVVHTDLNCLSVIQFAVVLRDAWERGQDLTVHGWIYGLHDGLLSDLHVTVDSQHDVLTSYEAAIALLPGAAAT